MKGNKRSDNSKQLLTSEVRPAETAEQELNSHLGTNPNSITASASLDTFVSLSFLMCKMGVKSLPPWL